jgi:BASS family bile acid:Na+ symporter
VALSITLTTVSTLLAVVLTPLLTLLYVGERVPVPAGDMLVSILQVVLAPVALGVLVNRFAGQRLGTVRRFFPLLSVAAIVLIIAIIVALNRGSLAAMGPAAALAVVLHNGVGLTAGYGLARLAVALAVKYFSTAAALPGAIFSVWHNLSGSALAAWWSRRTLSPEENNGQRMNANESE